MMRHETMRARTPSTHLHLLTCRFQCCHPRPTPLWAREARRTTSLRSSASLARRSSSSSLAYPAADDIRKEGDCDRPRSRRGEVEEDVKDIKGKQRVDVDLSGETRNDDTCLANGSILERDT